jgi:hypothetical protein
MGKLIRGSAIADVVTLTNRGKERLSLGDFADSRGDAFLIVRNALKLLPGASKKPRCAPRFRNDFAGIISRNAPDEMIPELVVAIAAT